MSNGSHPLALAAGQGTAALPDPGVPALGQPRDDLVDPGQPRGLAHLLGARPGTSDPDVVLDVALEQVDVLEDHGDQ
nr:hypothetical protein [Frankia sp. Mgl5]